jgi:hypothetical protein
MRHAVSASVLFLATLAVGPIPAAAEGLYLKLDGPRSGVPAGQPVRVRLKAVATRPFHLVGAPEFLVDDGKQVRTAEETELTAVDARPLAVTPDQPASREWELALPQPGRYKVRVRYRLADRVIESNKISVEVAAPRAAAQ